MKKGQIEEGRVKYSEFPNMGAVYIEEEGSEPVIVGVKNALPGQKVSVRLVKKRNGRWRGNLQEILERSEDESTESDCEFYGLTAFGETAYCGSCLYRSLPYERELEIKGDQIKRLLSPVVPDFDDIFEGVTGPKKQDHYRNKMELSFGDDRPGGELLLGLHRRGSMYDIISCSGCRLMHPDMDEVRRITEMFFRQRQVSYLHKRSHEGYLRHLLLRRSEASGELLVGLVTTTQSTVLYGCAGEDAAASGSIEEEGQLLEEYASALFSGNYVGKIAGILHIKNDRLGDVVVDEGTDILYGKDYITESVLGLDFKITPFSFFQTNTEGAGLLYSKVREYITDALAEDGGDGTTGTLYDLYSGTGTIAQILSSVAKEVIGVEIVEEAVMAAKENAAANGLSNCSFIAGDVLKVLDEISTKPDFIILDPPRDGIHPKALPKLLSYGVKHMIYISCKASSLARDLPFFLDAGYVPQRISCTDLFCRTGNVETICQLSKQKRKPDTHIDFELTADEYEKLAGDEHYKIMDEWKGKIRSDK